MKINKAVISCAGPDQHAIRVMTLRMPTYITIKDMKKDREKDRKIYFPLFSSKNSVEL